MRMPDGSKGLRESNGTVFLFTVIPALVQRFFRLDARRAERSHVGENQVVVRSRHSPSEGHSPLARWRGFLEFLTIWLAYALNSGCAASCNATADAGDAVLVRPALHSRKHGLLTAWRARRFSP